MKKKLTLAWDKKSFAFKHLLLVMKITVFLIVFSIAAVMANSGHSQETKFSVHLSNASLGEILNNIEDNSNYYFMYNNELIDLSKRMDIDAQNKTIDEILTLLFEKTGINYKIYNRQIVLSPISQENNDFTLQQQISISGHVTDSSGAPLPGVTVVVKGTTQGIITDTDGNYSFAKVPADATLVFSFVGMKTQEIAVAGKGVIDVVMREETVGIEEVVAVGYGTMRKSDLTGSLSSVSSEDFKDQPLVNTVDILQGRAAGVNVTTNSNGPGAVNKIRIRGANSISGGNDPLIVIDGISSGISLDDISPSDIESIEILKDASATAIYGNRGANGVILVTTKRGKEGLSQINLNSFVSFNKPTNKYELMSPYEYALYLNDVNDSEIFSSEVLQQYKNGTLGTDWQDMVLRDALTQNHQLSMQGGKSDVKYYLTFRYQDQDGILENIHDENYNLHANIDAKVFKNVDIGVDIFMRRYKGHNLNNYGNKKDPLFASLLWSPTESVYNSDGTYNDSDDWGALLENPYKKVMEKINDKTYNSAMATYNLKWGITDYLSLEYRFSANFSGTDNSSFEGPEYSNSEPTASITSTHGFSWLNNLILTYNKTFAEKHKLVVTAATEQNKSESKSNSSGATDFPTYALGYWNIGLASTQTSGSSYSEYSLCSFMGRASYIYDDRYLVTATVRTDGTSKFQGDNKWGYFPSFAAAWRLSNEEFIKDLNVFDNLKIRTSWGVTGNQAIGSYQTLALLSRYTHSYGTSSLYSGYGPKQVNSGLSWEETKQFDIGFDLGVWDNRLSVSLDYYRKNTDKLLLQQELPIFAGEGSIWKNAGKVRNQGVEGTITVVPVNKKDISWDISLNGSHTKNEVVDLAGEERLFLGKKYGAGLMDSEVFAVMPGYSLGTMWGYKWLGVWQKNEAEEAAKYGKNPGDNKYKDIDGGYSYSASDKEVIGCGLPDFIWGLNTSIRYKQFDLNLFFQGVHGNDVLNVSYGAISSVLADSRSITSREAGLNYWTEDNPSNKWANPKSSTNTTMMESSQWIQNGSYVRLKNIKLAYTFSKSQVKLGSLSLFVSAQNLFTITRYKGYDPAASITGTSDIDSGFDMGSVPAARVYTVGLNLTL